ncbi:OsmC family protein [Shewanella surugensis]|uniref:OsmC family protein n=1 Tax=Shewanella surugensis TaxID=212020 RepID=A0ABT0LHT0_9GAMM|nr:OsmC family protein [Shewanella surugensis]MCL1126681.1 OsmC family protein [Shewanella surugensis]
MPEKMISLQTQMTTDWKVTAQVRDHALVIDQPSATNAGATPLELFIFSLAGCISTIGKMVARDEGIVIRRFDVNMSATINTDGLLGKETADPIGFKSIDILADIDADLTDIEKQYFLDLVCHRCPIHDNLLNLTLVTHNAG